MTTRIGACCRTLTRQCMHAHRRRTCRPCSPTARPDLDRAGRGSRRGPARAVAPRQDRRTRSHPARGMANCWRSPHLGAARPRRSARRRAGHGAVARRSSAALGARTIHPGAGRSLRSAAPFEFARWCSIAPQRRLRRGPLAAPGHPDHLTGSDAHRPRRASEHCRARPIGRRGSPPRSPDDRGSGPLCRTTAPCAWAPDATRPHRVGRSARWIRRRGESIGGPNWPSAAAPSASRRARTPVPRAPRRSTLSAGLRATRVADRPRSRRVEVPRFSQRLLCRSGARESADRGRVDGVAVHRRHVRPRNRRRGTRNSGPSAVGPDQRLTPPGTAVTRCGAHVRGSPALPTRLRRDPTDPPEPNGAGHDAVDRSPNKSQAPDPSRAS